MMNSRISLSNRTESLKIVTWNCNGAFRKKIKAMCELESDIYVIQECENTEVAKREYKASGLNYVWHGSSPHKGIAIFAKPSAKLELLNWECNSLQLFLPVRVNDTFNLIGVWTKEANSPTFKYIGQVWKYLELHRGKMAVNTVLCGDLNSNKRWDVWDRWWNHSDVVRELDTLGMVSLYHEFFDEVQGCESRPTYYQHRNVEKSYHIDYAFTSRNLFDPKKHVVEVGECEKWLDLSDHMPVTFTIGA